MGRFTDLEIKLIEAAKDIVVEKGYESLSARAITAKCGCSVGSLYNYYKNISEIILLINSETLNALKKELRDVVKDDTKASLSRMISRTYLTFAKNNLAFWNLLYNYKYPSNQKLPPWYQQQVDDLFNIVDQAIKKHLPKKLRDSRLPARVLWAGIHGILMLELTGKLDIAHNEPAEVLCDSLFDQYLNN